MPLIKRERRFEESEIPTASMADIAFLLIIFFMLTTIFSRDKGLKLILPEKTTETAQVKKENTMRIFINPEGKIFVDDAIQETPISEIKKLVQERVEENPKAVIIIKTNIDADYSRMIDVYDEVLLAGDAIGKPLAVALQAIKPE